MENKNVECKNNLWSFGKEHPFLLTGLIYTGIKTVGYVVYVIGKVTMFKHGYKPTTDEPLKADYEEVNETETSNN